MKKVLILNGVNLNLTGEREPGVYGSETLSDINARIAEHAQKLSLDVDFFQTNVEGEFVEKIHSVYTAYDACIINAGAFSHYSYAVYDAIGAVRKPFIEVHMSNIHAREDWRRQSIISPVCVGMIAGFGKWSYILALDALKNIL